MACGTLRFLKYLQIKGQASDLSIIIGLAESWGIKGATTSAIPKQETDPTNLCPFLMQNKCVVQNIASYCTSFFIAILGGAPFCFWSLILDGCIPESPRLLHIRASSCSFLAFLSCDPHTTTTLQWAPERSAACLQPLGSFTSREDGSSGSQATHTLVPSEAGPFSFLRCMMLKIA